MQAGVRRLCEQLGVTRVARLTGLDRCGVEVAGAVRPSGHVLQVTQGKGLTWDAAVASALGEAAELAAAERVPAERLAWRDGAAYVEAIPFSPRGVEDVAFIPAELVWCPPEGTAWLGPVSHEWTSNGLGAHLNRALAVEHATLEVVERDAIARVLPEGFADRSAARLIAWSSPLAQRLALAGFELFVFDLTPARARLPVAGALLFDRDAGPIPLTAGYACRRTPGDAVEAAVLEAAQSRLTEVHGAREDVATGQRVSGAELRRHLAASRPRRALSGMPRWNGRLDEAARRPLFVVGLAHSPLCVVKVLGEGMLRSELL